MSKTIRLDITIVSKMESTNNEIEIKNNNFLFADSKYPHLMDAEKIVADFELALKSIKSHFESITVSCYTYESYNYSTNNYKNIDGFQVIRYYNEGCETSELSYDGKYKFSSHNGHFVADKKWKQKTIFAIRQMAMKANRKYQELRESELTAV